MSTERHDLQPNERLVCRRQFLTTTAASVAAVGASRPVLGDDTAIPEDGETNETDERQSDEDEADTLTVIEDWHDLHAVRDDLSGEYILANDLDSETPGYEEHVTDPDGGWSPIGADGDAFTGHFDGNHHDIADLEIDRPEEERIGLFARNRGKITRVSLVDCDVTGKNLVGALTGQNSVNSTITDSAVDAAVTALDSNGGLGGVGGVAGRNRGEIEWVSAEIEVTGTENTGGIVGNSRSRGTVYASVAEGEVTGDTNVGGLVGNSAGDVTESLAEVAVTGSGSNIGGLVGNFGSRTDNGTTLQQSYATGTVTADEESSSVGGLVGQNRDEITETYATGNVTGGERRTGGLVGENTDDGIVSKSYATGDVTSDGVRVGGLVGDNSDGAVVRQSYAAGEVSGSFSAAGLVGNNRRESELVRLYWDTEATGRDDETNRSQGNKTDVTGLTTAEMQGDAARENMDGLDFEETWAAVTDSADYPELRLPAVEPQAYNWADEVDPQPEEIEYPDENGDDGDDSENGSDDAADGFTDIPANESADGTDDAADDSSPGFGSITALTALGGVGYFLSRGSGTRTK